MTLLIQYKMCFFHSVFFYAFESELINLNHMKVWMQFKKIEPAPFLIVDWVSPLILLSNKWANSW